MININTEKNWEVANFELSKDKRFICSKCKKNVTLKQDRCSNCNEQLNWNDFIFPE